MKSTKSTTPPSDDGSSSSSSSSSISSSTSSNIRESSSNSSTTTTSTSSSSSILPRILSGSVGSIITALAVTPLEVVKIRQQSAGLQTNIAPTSFRGIKVAPCPAGCGTLVLNNGLMDCVLPIESTCLRGLRSSNQSQSLSAGSNTNATSRGNRGTLSTLLSIFKHEGYAGLYAGLRPTLVMSVPNTVMYFSAYDEISAWMRRYHIANFATSSNSTITMAVHHGNVNRNATTTNSTPAEMQAELEEDAKQQHPAYIPLVAGSTARLLASLATAPLELIRTRQASMGGSIGTSKIKNRMPTATGGMMTEFRSLLRANGVSSLYVGVAPTLWRDVPFSAIYWLFLERFRNGLANNDDDDVAGLLGDFGGRYYKDRGMTIPPSVEAGHAFVSGAAAGSIAAAFTTPFDVVKTRRQMVIGQAETIATTTTMTIESCNHLGLKEVGHHSNQGRFPSNNIINNASSSSSSTLGTFGHMQQIMEQEGIAGLWKGNVTRMVKVAPACAIMISCYEFGKRMFGEVL